MTTSGTTERADQIKGAVADQSGEVAQTAKEQVKQVASEAGSQARDLAAEAREQVRQQTDTQRERLAGTLHQLGDELRSMADEGQGNGVATEVARQAADRVHDLGSYVEHHQPGDLLEDVRRFARRRPGTFLLAAAAAGVVAGRLTRGARAAMSDSSSGSSYPSGTAYGTSYGTSYPAGGTYAAGGAQQAGYAPTPPPTTPATVTGTTATGGTGTGDEGVTGTGPLYAEEVVVEVDPTTRRSGGDLP